VLSAGTKGFGCWQYFSNASNAFEYKAEVGKADCQQTVVGQDGGNDEILTNASILSSVVASS